MANDCIPLVLGTQPISVDISFYVGFVWKIGSPPKNMPQCHHVPHQTGHFGGSIPHFLTHPIIIIIIIMFVIIIYSIHIYIYNYIYIYMICIHIYSYSVNQMILRSCSPQHLHKRPRSSRLGCAPRLSGGKWVPRRRWSSAAFPAQLSLGMEKPHGKTGGRTMGKHGNSEWVWACLWNSPILGEWTSSIYTSWIPLHTWRILWVYGDPLQCPTSSPTSWKELGISSSGCGAVVFFKQKYNPGEIYTRLELGYGGPP